MASGRDLRHNETMVGEPWAEVAGISEQPVDWMGVSHLTAVGPLHLATVADRSSPPILFLHGVTRGWRDWSLVVAALSTRWHPYAVDFRGHGESARVPNGYRVAQYVDDAVRIAHEVVGRPLIVVGHSLGAMVALAVAARLPGEVLGLVMEDPPFDTMGTRIVDSPLQSQFIQTRSILTDHPHATVPELARRLADIELEDPVRNCRYRLGERRDQAALRFHASCLATLDREVLDPIIAGQWLEGFPWRRWAKQISAPTLLLQADSAVGGMLVDEDAQCLRNAIEDLTLVSFGGIGHQIHQSEPNRFVSVLSTFLESLPIENPI